MKNNYDTSLIALVGSFTLHLLVFYIIVFGLPFSAPLPEEEQIITFDMLPVSHVSNVPTKEAMQQEVGDTEDAKKVIQTKPPVPDVVKQEEPKPTPKAELKAEPQNEKPEDKEAIIIKKPEPAPKKEIKPEPEKPSKKEPPKPEKKEPKPDKKKKIMNDNDLNSLLKTLEQSSDGDNNKSTKYAKKLKDTSADKESKGTYDETSPLSVSEIALITQQIEKHWNRPIGVANLEQIIITIHIIFNKDGSVKDAQIIDTVCGAATRDICQITADSAKRAVWQASPIENLSPERYDVWKEFNFKFNPKD